mmetsp:Transcript_105214/g.209154  ORF Transcript_105214/g.209154 Transcript_105214/m.209154 type:complete len:231 (+) Transcript_105214:339-1031(+)
MPSFASLMRAINADDGFLAVAKFPRARTTLCKPGAKSRRSAAARASISFSLMNASTSSLLGKPAPPGIARLPPPARISLILAKSSVEGSWVPARRPIDSTARFTVGELLRSVSAALAPMPDSLMKSSMLCVLGSPCPPPAQEPAMLPLRNSARASRIRASNAAEGFLAVERSPRAKARRWTSMGQSRRSAAARSSMSLALMKSSTSRRDTPSSSSEPPMVGGTRALIWLL